MNSASKLLQRHVEIPDRREIWDWANDHVDFGSSTAFPGKYSVENTPWNREMLRAARDPYVRVVTMIAPPQESGKTISAEVILAHRICTEPVPMAYNITTNTKAEIWSETRFDRLVKACPMLSEKFSKNRHAKKRRRVVFRDGTFLLIQGAEVEGNRAGDSIAFQIDDEVALWEKPWLKEMHDRLNAYREKRKIIHISTGGEKGGELHDEWLTGNQLEWSHRCPKCKQPFTYVHNPRDPKCNIRYDLNAAVIHADGRLDLREFAKTVHVVCPDKNCAEKMFYDRERLARQNAEGLYVPQNPEADPQFVSLHVNSFAIGRTPWVELLAPYVKLHIRGGVFAPEVLKEFVTKTCAEFWDERPYFVPTELKLSNYTRKEVLKPGDWKHESFRIMSGDNQRGAKGDIPHRWFVCRAFGKDETGIWRSRLVDCGRVDEWNALRQKQIELGVPMSNPANPGPWVVIDRRWDPTEVDEKCSLYHWHGMMGAPSQEEFLHPPDSPFAGTRQLFSEQRAIDVGFGTAQTGRQYALYFLFAAQRVADIWHQLLSGGLAEIPRDIGEFCPEYVQHVNSHRQIMEATKTGGEKRLWKRIGNTDDHLRSCEIELTVCGLMAGIYKRE